MMFNLTHPLPKTLAVAVSGGADSMAALHWLNRTHKVELVLHINHRTEQFSDNAEGLVREYCESLGVPVWVSVLSADVPKTENAWREERYKFFHSFACEVATAHHYNDALEEYLMCVLKRGYIGSIPYRNHNVIRPFRKWRKESILDYAERNKIPYLNDPENENLGHLRNKIRRDLVPLALEVNEGIEKLVWRAIEEQDSRDK
jgi:tRNA(Ile)-lysidine synthase